MTAIGVLLLGFGGMTVWAGFTRTNVFDVFRAVLGQTVPARTSTGALKNPKLQSLGTVKTTAATTSSAPAGTTLD